MTKGQTWVIVLHVLALALIVLLMVVSVMSMGSQQLVLSLFLTACAIAASLIWNVARFVSWSRR
jgi:hypothetical protein